MRALSEACAAKASPSSPTRSITACNTKGRAVSALEVTDEVYVINSFSKYFSMTGWRLGWMVVPPDHVRRVERLAQNMFICPAHASQVAALGALSPEGRAELDEHRVTYARNREVLLDGLAEAGLTRTAPADGAFYVYVDVGHLTGDSLALASRILEEADVAVTPGLDFDKGRGHARCACPTRAARRDREGRGAPDAVFRAGLTVPSRAWDGPRDLLDFGNETDPGIRPCAEQSILRRLCAVLSCDVDGPALAQAFGALARVVPEETRVETGGGGVTLRLGLSQPVPFRVFALDDPWRVVVDFREVIWDGVPTAFGRSRACPRSRWARPSRPGWSRMVLSLEAPMLPRIAAMETDASNRAGRRHPDAPSPAECGFGDAAGMPDGLASGVSPQTQAATRPRGRRSSSCSTPAMAASIPGPCGAITPRPTSS
jgi:hypothetical protein